MFSRKAKRDLEVSWAHRLLALRFRVATPNLNQDDAEPRILNPFIYFSGAKVWFSGEPDPNRNMQGAHLHTHRRMIVMIF